MKFYLSLFLFVGSISLKAQALLPVEVLGEQGKVVQRSITLSATQAASVDRLWMQINNLSYENKASVKINNGEWLDLNHETVDMQYQEKARGGMVHGGYSTVRLSIPVAGFEEGVNTIHFRFNRSDGISIGYRVVDFNLLTAAGAQILGDEYFVEEDPFEWEAPYSDAAAIAEGKELWENAALWSNYLEEDTLGKWYAYDLEASVPIKATCADCHVSNGYDLEYFSYSNESIIERSKFHNLSEDEGKKIASYIRTLSDEIPQLERYGRPWNPPYQPGTELEGKSIDEWAAGAGLDAVLDQDTDMLSHMFPGGVIDSVTIADYFDSDKVEDHTLVPLSVQLPDWKHWLPIVHPMDAFSKNDFYHTSDVPIHPKKGMERMDAYLEAMPPADRNKDELQNELRIFHRHFRHFMDQTEGEVRHWRTGGDAVRENKYNERVAAIPEEVPVEMAVTSLARLLAVKNFEYMNTYELQDKAHWFTIEADSSELTPRGWQWIGIDYNVFEVPPHFTSCVTSVNCDEFVGQPTETGHYESTAWYQLQLVINGGNGHTGPNHPMDWQYQLDFIKRASFSSGIPEPIRYYHSINAMYQLRTNEKNKGPNSGRGFRARQQMPHWFYGVNDNNSFSGFEPGAYPALLDEVQPGMQRMIMNALLSQFLREMHKPEMALNRWNRRSPNGGSNELEPTSKSGALVNIEQKLGLYYYTDKMFYLIPKFAEIGVDCRIINELVDWSAEAWPNYNWDQFRQLTQVSLKLDHDGLGECDPIPEQFVAVVGNQGENPVYEWKVNGTIQPEASAEFYYAGLEPGDEVSVRVISSRTCVNKKEAVASYTVPGEHYVVMINKNNQGWNETNAMDVCDDDEINIKVGLPIKPMLWLDANQLSSSISDGDRVSQWMDRSGNDYQVATENEELYPYYDDQGLNGLPAVMFGMNNNADGLRLFTTEEDDFMEDDWTMAIVGEELGIDNWADVVGNKTESQDDDGWFMRFSKEGISEISAGGAYYRGNNYQFPFAFIAVMQKKGREVTLHLNGKFERSLTMEDGEQITTANEIFLGLSDKGNANSGRYHKGPISEVMFFDHALDGADRKVLEGYLGHKWNLSTSFSPSHLYANNSPLDVNLTLPNEQVVEFNSASKTFSYVVDKNLQGELLFSPGACPSKGYVVDASYSHDPELLNYSVSYSLDDQPYLEDTSVSVSQGQSLSLIPGGDFGDYQWQQPDGTLLAINANPELSDISNDHLIGEWVMHVGIGVCYKDQQQDIPFEVSFSEGAPHVVNVALEGSGASNIAGAVNVNDGNGLKLDLVPDQGFKVAEILVDGVSQDIPANNGQSISYTLSNVNTSLDLLVKFEAREVHSISLAIAEGGSGSLSNGAHEVFEGDAWTVTLDAENGFKIREVLIDGEPQGTLSVIQIDEVSADHSVEAQFEAFSYEIASSAGENGSVSPEGVNRFDHGEDAAFAFTPDEGYEIDEIWIDGQNRGEMTDHVFNDVSSSHTIHATFKPIPVYYTVEVIQPENGTISPESQEVLDGENVSFIITPDDGYYIENVIVDGEPEGALERYTFKHISESHTIEAQFGKFVVAGMETQASNIYPNPVVQDFNIASTRRISKLEIIDMSGKKLPFRASSDFSEVTLNSRGSNNAILMVHLYYEDGGRDVIKLIQK